MMSERFRAPVECTVCGTPAAAFDVVDFNKSCEDARRGALPLSGEPIYYHRCDRCGFCFAPDLCAWPPERFAERIYNEGYAAVDPDYLEARPVANAGFLLSAVPRTAGFRHLDYGGGNGRLSRTLQEAGWRSESWDPFVDAAIDLLSLGSFSLITAFEVFEHVPNVHATLAELLPLLRADGALFVTTTLSDGEITPGRRLEWWYAAPRNGHVALHSRTSLGFLAETYGLRLHSLSHWEHLFLCETVPAWAAAMSAKRPAALARA